MSSPANASTPSAGTNPESQSRWWRTSSRPGYRSASAASAAPKITEPASRFAVRIRTRRPVVASALLASERIGVIPLPPANATSGASLSRRQNTPAGRVTSTTSPAARLSCIQLETSPPGTRFTVVISSASVAWQLDIE